MPRTSSIRRPLLDAAAEIIATRGGSALTLEAVAEQAGVSKGGLLYHFPSKDALMRALLEHLSAEHFAAIDAEYATQGRRSLAAAHLAASTTPKPQPDPLFAHISSVLFMNRELLGVWEAHHRQWFDRLAKESDDFELDAIVSLAAYALWMDESCGVEPLRPAQRARLLRRMAQLVERPARGAGVARGRARGGPKATAARGPREAAR